MSNFTFDENSIIINDFEALLSLQRFYGLIISSAIANRINEIDRIRKEKMKSNIHRAGEDFLEHEDYEFLVMDLIHEDFDLDKLASLFPNKNIEFYSQNKLINSINIQNN